MFGSKNYRPVMVLGVVPSRCHLNTSVCGRSKYFFVVNPLKVCRTKIDRIRSMGICPLTLLFVVAWQQNFP